MGSTSNSCAGGQILPPLTMDLLVACLINAFLASVFGVDSLVLVSLSIQMNLRVLHVVLVYDIKPQ